MTVKHHINNLLAFPIAGCLHPDHRGYFKDPAEYMAWYRRHGRLRNETGSPKVAILLYRKHVITAQPYLAGLIRTMEAQGVTPVPIFINGIEAHTVVSCLPPFWAFASLLVECSG